MTNAKPLLRLPDVLDLAPFGKTEIYKRIRAGTFPPPIKIAPRLSVWPAAEVFSALDALARRS